ncbi:MAG: hypothetical protein E6I48_05170 [Chloroflexi bacterium]|nr:MAG: hypothetical protein E6I48_05170 [Chloroflexota bacterium]
MARAKRSSAAWDTGVVGLLRLQQSYFRRVAAYAETIRKRAATGPAEPSEWIGDYAEFVRGVIDDAGEWVLGRADDSPLGYDWLPLYRAQLRRNEGATKVDVKIPMRAFEGQPGDDPEITLVLDWLGPRGGGTLIEGPRHLQFHRERVPRSEPWTTLRVFGIRDVERVGGVYSGIIWTKETRLPVAAVEITVL